MAWKKRGNARNITEVIKEISRLSLEEVSNPAPTSSLSIMGMEEAADILLHAIESKSPITIVGDYDADGITSTAILWYVLRYLDVTPRTRLPKRYSEGYGLSMRVVDEIDSGVVITVDNGIAALEQVKAAKRKGLTVIVLDHHLPGNELPEADIVVDPHIAPEQSGFSDYCGAGLSYKMAQLLIDDDDFLRKMEALAAIGTVADVMPLIGDNRIIVKEGLQCINQHDLPVGLLALINAVGARKVDEQTIGFTIGPLLNAPGRLRDDGAMESLQLLITEDYAEAEAKAFALIETNNMRKDLLKKGMERAYEILHREEKENVNPICIYDPELLAGLAGLVAGRLAEEYKTPTIVLTKTEDGQMKGSGRSYGDIHLKYLLDDVCGYLSHYGGHAGAAGLSLIAEHFEDFRCALEEHMKEYTRPDGTEFFYDLEATVAELPRIMEDLKRYAPFGEANPRPVIKIDNIILLPQAGKLYRTMGDHEEHIKLLGKDFSVIGFNMTEEYVRQGKPEIINVIGYLTSTNFRREEQLELEAIAFEKQEQVKRNTLLGNQMLLSLSGFADIGGEGGSAGC